MDEINYTDITLLPDNVLITFTDRVIGGKFTNERSSGVVDDLGKNYMLYGGISRCAIVHAIGSNVKSVSVGDEVIIENLKWTPEFTLNGSSFWMTTHKFILGTVTR